MNDFSELESELRKLRPIAASDALTSRIERALSEPPAVSVPTSAVIARPKSLRINWLSLGLGLAAATVFLLLAKVGEDPSRKNSPGVASTPRSPSQKAVANTGQFVPTGMTQVVYNARDEWLVYADGADRPVRRLRYRTQETLQWQQSATGASLRVTYPSEEVVLMPISGQ